MTIIYAYHKKLSLPAHHLQQVLQRIQVARIGIHVEDVAIAVDEFVGREAVHAKEVFDGSLLLGRPMPCFYFWQMFRYLANR